MNEYIKDQRRETLIIGPLLHSLPYTLPDNLKQQAYILKRTETWTTKDRD